MQYDRILVTKTLLLLLIILTPFLPMQLIIYLDNLLFKCIFVILIIYMAAIDIQIAILMTLWFLVVLAMMNMRGVNIIQTPKTNEKSEPIAPILPVVPEKSSETVTYYEPETFQAPIDFKPSTLPTPYCPVYDQYVMNESMKDYSLDEKTKPYESYIKQLSPDESFKKIQTNL